MQHLPHRTMLSVQQSLQPPATITIPMTHQRWRLYYLYLAIKKFWLSASVNFSASSTLEMMMSITSSCHHTRSAWWMCAADTVTVVSSSKVVLVLRDFGWLKHVSWIYSAAAADLTRSVDLESEFQLWTVRGLGARILVRRLASSSPHSSCSASSAMSPTSPSSNIAGCRHCRLVTCHRLKGGGWTSGPCFYWLSIILKLFPLIQAEV